MAAAKEYSSELDKLVQSFHDGVAQLASNVAVDEITHWQDKLHEANKPELKAVAHDLDSLKKLLTGDAPDGKAIGKILVKLGDHIEGLNKTEVSQGVKRRLHSLGALLHNEGEELSTGHAADGATK